MKNDREAAFWKTRDGTVLPDDLQAALNKAWEEMERHRDQAQCSACLAYLPDGNIAFCPGCGRPFVDPVGR